MRRDAAAVILSSDRLNLLKDDESCHGSQLNMDPEMDMNKNFENSPDGNVACFLCMLLIPRILCVCV